MSNGLFTFLGRRQAIGSIRSKCRPTRRPLFRRYWKVGNILLGWYMLSIGTYYRKWANLKPKADIMISGKLYYSNRLLCTWLQIEENGLNSVNVRDVLLEMRRYRMGLIQTPDQLRFSYAAIIEGAKQLPLNDVVINANTLFRLEYNNYSDRLYVSSVFLFLLNVACFSSTRLRQTKPSK